MIVIPDKKLVLLLPWKTASQTLSARLGTVGKTPYPKFFAFNPHLNCVVHQHLTLPQFLALPEARQGCRLAVFVRNPYDRVVSGFIQLQRDVVQQRNAVFPQPWISSMVMRQLALHQRRLEAAKGDVNAWFRLLPDALIRCGGLDTSLPLHPVHYWTHMAGRRAAAFVGRVESFEADFLRLCETFDLPVPPRVNVNVTQGMRRPPDENGYRHAGILAPDVVTRINALFAEDFRYYGYRILEGGPVTARGT